MDTPVEFQPERFSRRGEATAWGLAVIALAAWAWTAWRGLETPSVLPFVAGFCVLAGLAISLTNWVDRHTRLRIDETGVRFENGLRRVQMGWEEIQEMRVFPSNLGDQVRVMGGNTFFTFRTLGEARMGEQVRGRMGFAEGEHIANHIRQKARLTRVQETRAGYRYSKE